MFKRLMCIMLSVMLLLGSVFAIGCGSKPFTVTFDANGGYFVAGDEDLQVQTVNSASEIKVPTVKKAGYSFDGWDKVLSKITKDTTVKASWSKRPNFKVTFRGNGGTLVSGVEEQNVTDASFIVPPLYERTGYALTWSEDIPSLVEDAVINAVWVPNVYKLKFISGEFENWNGFDLNSYVEVAYDSQIDASTLPSPTYLNDTDPENPVEKRLGGWVVVDNDQPSEYDGLKIYAGNTWKFLKDISVKPIWRNRTEFLINYNLDGGQFDNNGGINSFKVTDQDFTLNNPVRTGYDFIGWTGEGITEPTMLVTVKQGTESDLTYTAHWIAKTFTIELDVGEGTADKKNMTFTYGQKIGELPVPEREGYVFVSWNYGTYSFYGGDNGNTVWEIDKPVTLTAVYLRIYTVKYVLKYSYVQRWEIQGVPGSKKHNIVFNYNGESSIPDTTILEGDYLYKVTEDYDSNNIFTNPVNGEIEYKFTGWAYTVNGVHSPVTDMTLAIESRAVNGVITLTAIGQSLYWGPY